MTREIQIQQALHGYLDGHQLLASSMALPRDLHSLVLTMSDLSGPAFRRGFESYLTGYPLESIGHYCLAKTWIAPEQSRPGCVWTHSLMVRFEDLARLSNIQDLLAAFRRPASLDDRLTYELPIESMGAFSDSHELALRKVRLVDPVLSKSTLGALYGTERRVVVSGDNAYRYEDMVVSIFAQQWPRLRRSFWFCTGSLSLRGTRFDLSVSPPELSRSSDEKVVFVEAGVSEVRKDPEWLELAAEDLVLPFRSTFRAFLSHYGSDYPSGRAAFRPLAELYLLLFSPQSEPRYVGDRALSAVSAYFPAPEDGYRLKRDLFGPGGRYLDAVGGDEAVLRLALTHPAALSIDDTTADVERRAEMLAISEPNEALGLAVEALTLGGINGDFYLAGYFRAVTDIGPLVLKAPSSSVLDYLARRPDLLGEPTTWLSLNGCGLAGETIFRIQRASVDFGPIISAMIASEAWSVLTLAVRHLGAVALQEIADSLQSKAVDVGRIDFPSQLFGVLWSSPELTVDLVSRGLVPSVPLKMIFAEADPRSLRFRHLSVDALIEASNCPLHFVDAYRTRSFATFCLIVALFKKAANSPVVISRVFGFVYETMDFGTLEPALWRRLEPSLAWYASSAGLTARLVKTVARAFCEEKWPAAFFIQTFHHFEWLRLALKELDDTSKGPRYIKHVKEEARKGQVHLSSEQAALLSHF